MHGTGQNKPRPVRTGASLNPHVCCGLCPPLLFTHDPTGTGAVRWQLSQDDGPHRTPRRDQLPVRQRRRKLLDHRWWAGSNGQRMEDKHPGRAGIVTTA